MRIASCFTENTRLIGKVKRCFTGNEVKHEVWTLSCKVKQTALHCIRPPRPNTLADELAILPCVFSSA